MLLPLTASIVMLLLTSCNAISNHPRIFIVPHSHQDLGWLKTPEEYYDPPKIKEDPGRDRRDLPKYLHECVKCIYDEVFKNLAENPARRFTFSDMGFFYMWWKEQNITTKQIFKSMIKKERIEIVSGGWVSNDEACSHYEDIITQYEMGHSLLLKEFNNIPQIAWQLDPFGHSASNAILSMAMGLRYMTMARIHYLDKEARKMEQSLDLLWQPRLNENEDILFTYVLANHYSPPSGMCWDNSSWCHDQELNETNIIDKALFTLNAEVQRNSVERRSPNHMLLFGDDFSYVNGSRYFRNIDVLIQKASNNKSLPINNIGYATPSLFFKEISKNTTLNYPKKFDDFFPYSDYPKTYWAGYFSSRGTLKFAIRQLGIKHRLLSRLLAIYSLQGFTIKDSFRRGLENMGLVVAAMQHHDAITGTSKEKVSNNFLDKVSTAVYEAEKELGTHFKETHQYGISGYFNSSICEITANRSICNEFWKNVSLNSSGNISLRMLVLSAGTGRTDLIIRTPYSNLEVWNTNAEVPAETICTSPKNCLLFLSIGSNKIEWINLWIKSSEKNKEPLSCKNVKEPETSLKINDSVSLTFNKQDSSYRLDICAKGKPVCKRSHFSLKYNAYVETKSGAYLFRPGSTSSFRETSRIENQSLKVCSGNSAQAFVFEDSDFLGILVSSYGSLENGLTLLTTVKSTGRNNAEYTVNIKNSQISNFEIFFTDGNGMHSMPRRRNYQTNFDMKCEQNYKPCNYFPMTAFTYLQDLNDRLSWMTAQGVTNPSKGEIEVMVHRKASTDDYRGMGEGLVEKDESGFPVEITVRHRLFMNDFTSEENIENFLGSMQNKIDFPPVYFLQEKLLAQESQQQLKPLFNPVSLSLPSQDECLKISVTSHAGLNFTIFLHNRCSSQKSISFMKKRENQILNRISSGRCKHVISSISELSLTGNQIRDELASLDKVFFWNNYRKNNLKSADNFDEIQLAVQEIRRFSVKLKNLSCPA